MFPYLYRALIDLEPVPVVALTLRDGCLLFVLAALVRHARQEAKNPQSGELATRGVTREWQTVAQLSRSACQRMKERRPFVAIRQVGRPQRVTLPSTANPE